MKITHRISTGQFEYVEIEQDFKDTAYVESEMPSVIKSAHDDYVNAFKPKPINSLSDKEFDTFIQQQLEGEGNHIEDYEKCSPDQKKIVQLIKRALKRITYKNRPDEPVI